jgi:uracil-DNA glycosylase
MPREDVREMIWGNWVDHTENCKECPAHDHGYRPRYGGGDVDSHVMVVLSDPNDGRSPVRTSLDDPDSENESWRYGFKADNGWDMMEDYLNPICRRIDGCEDADDIYFTNAHKCPKLSGKGVNFDPDLDFEPLDHCTGYLDNEIKAVEPEVVVGLSAPTTRALGACQSVEFDDPKKVTEYVEDWVSSNKRAYGSDPAVVAGVHPSLGKLHLHLEREWYGNTDHDVWYFEELAKSVNTVLT